MNSQENVEKHLLQQITYLTRLIEENTHSNPKELQLKPKNQNYKLQTTSLISNKRLLKPEIKSEIPTSSENKLQSSLSLKSSNSVKNCDLNSQPPHSKLPESFKTKNKNVVLLTHIKKGTPEISLKEISVTKSVNPSISAVKKCIHVNRKVLFKNSSESTNDKTAVDTNCVHINPAKLTVCKSNQKSLTENKSDDARKVIHINPKYKLVKLSNSSNLLENNEPCDQVLGDKKLKIHFNKNFIVKHPQKLPEASHLNEVNLSSFKLPQTKQNIIQVTDKPNLNIPICNQNEKCLTSAKSSSANVSTLVNKNLFQLPVISESSSSNLSSKNGNKKCSDVLRKSVVSPIKVIKAPLSSQNLLNCNSNSKYKFTRKNKLVQQKVQPVFKQNNLTLSTKLIKLSKTKLIRRELMSTNKIKNKVCKVNKCLKYTPEQTSNKYKINRTLLNSVKEFDKSPNSKLNKNVWISPLNQSRSNTKTNKDKTVNIIANTSNKFKLKNSNSTKTNSLKSPLRLSSKILNLNSQDNLKPQNSVCPKGKYGVQKHRILLRKRLSSSSSLISLSPTKLIRKSLTNATANSKLCSKNLRKINISGNTNTSSVPVINTNLKLSAQNKVSPSLRTARSLKTKYKFIRNANLNRSRFNWNSAIRKSQKINLKATVNRRSRTNSSVNRKSITISGIKYHLTKTKLRRKFSSEKRRSSNKIFRNKGDSFRISSSGKSLKRINGPVSNRNLYLSLYYRNKCLQRSETNFARNKVIQAKQRSIALLTKKLRKNNEPCLIFNRFGRCSGKERGTCNRVHDRKRVAICKKFLLGACLKKDCLLSHDVGLSKMPTCRHYLAGICMREDCPYLHVKLNSSAPICIPFLQGYCSKAEKCKQRHIYVCPEFEEKGQCSKGKSCKYPHPKCKNLPKEDNSDNLVKSESCRINVENVVVSDAVGIEDSSSNRYYTATDCSTENDKMSIVKRKIDDVDEPDSVGNEWLRKRPRVGQLPGYIPLNFDD